MKNQQAAEQLGAFGGGDNLNTRVGVGGTGLRAFFSLPAERVQLLIETAVRKGIGEGLRTTITGGQPTLSERIAGRPKQVSERLDELLEDPEKNKQLIKEEFPKFDAQMYQNLGQFTPREKGELDSLQKQLQDNISERQSEIPSYLRGGPVLRSMEAEMARKVGEKEQTLQQTAAERQKEYLKTQKDLEVSERDKIDKTKTFVKGLGLAITTIGLVVGALSRFRDALVQISQQLGGVSVGKALEERIAAFINSLSTGFTVSSQRILETQGALAQEFGRLSTSGSALDLTKVAQSYGLTAQQLVGLERTLQSNALSASDALDAFREQGIVSGVAAEEINKNMAAVARAGDKFNEFIVEGIANAKRLGLEFGKIEQTLTGFATNFEGTVESFAQARALIPGFATDFSELFSVALDGSTDDLINIVREDLQGAGITSASELNRAALSNLEQATGFTADQIDRILANEDINFDAQMDLDANRNFLLKGIIVALATVGGAIVGTIIGLGTGLTGIAGGTAAAGALAGIKSGALSGAIVGGVVGTGTTFGLPAITGNDIVSKPGYGERTLVTPTGNIALNNRDTLVAGTELYGKGEISSQQADYRSLETRLDKLIMLQERSLAPREINITGFDKAMESQQQNAIRNY
jgi:hypothetical protein